MQTEIHKKYNVKYIEPSEKVIQQLPNEQVLKNYGRSSKLLLAAKDVPDLQFDVAELEEKGESAIRADVIEIIDMDTNGSVTTLHNSDSREHSRNLLGSAAVEAPDQVSEHRSVEKTKDPEMHNGTSEYREHSQKLQSSDKVADEKRQKKLCIKRWTEARTRETVKIKNILETRR